MKSAVYLSLLKKMDGWLAHYFYTDGNISALLMINSDIGLDTVSLCLRKGYIDYYE